MAQVRIGTSGWHYKHWIGRYYPADIKPAAMLEYYLRDFEITTRWTYVRLHGPTQFKYQGSYSDAQLEKWAGRIEGWLKKLDAIYVYFDNDDSAFAVNNALTLKRLISASSRP